MGLLTFQLKISYFYTLMTLLLKTMPDINQALLQFIDVMNLVDLLLLLHFSPYRVAQKSKLLTQYNSLLFLSHPVCHQ